MARVTPWISMDKIPQLLVHNRRDNVGVVVVENLTAGTDLLCVVTEDNSEFRGVLNQNVPLGHKVALKDLSVGDTVIKYGEDIGRIVAPVRKGDHVHTHNLKTKRW
jgi:(2R)-sulfolactate sulfo-lyase subunit alpha